MQSQRLFQNLADMVGKKRTATEIETASANRKIKTSKISSCSRRRGAKWCTVSIPEEIICNILLCLPVDVLYNVMRYVCRQWYNIIHSPTFIYSHLQESNTGLLVQRRYFLASGFFVQMRESDVEVRKQEFQFNGFAVASCNGLVWFVDYDRWQYSCVVNPVTKQQLSLPPFDCFLDRKCCFLDIDYCSLGYAAASGVYKVVYSQPMDTCAILTVGVDNLWRAIDISQLTSSTEAFLYRPLSVGGFVYWAGFDLPFVLSLNIETETFKQIPLPEVLPRDIGKVLQLTLLAMGSSLSLMLLREEYLWQVWLLTDLETGQWAKLRDINLQGQRHILQDLYRPREQDLHPMGWLRSRELLVLRVPFTATYVVYNVKNGRIRSSFEVGSNEHLFRLESHAYVNSLVPLNG